MSASNEASSHSLDTILASLNASGVRDAHDTCFLVLHAFMVSAGFRLVGFGDSGNIVGTHSHTVIFLEQTIDFVGHMSNECVGTSWQPHSRFADPCSARHVGHLVTYHPNCDNFAAESRELPRGWQQGQVESSGTSSSGPTDVWAFRYRHSKSSMTFVVKALRMGSRLSVHAYIVEQDEVIVNLEVPVSQYVDGNSDSFKQFIASQTQTDSAAGTATQSATTQASTATSTQSPSTASSVPTVWTKFLKNIAELHDKYKKEVMIRLMPDVEDLANQLRIGGAAGVPLGQGQPAQQEPRRDPLRVYPEDRRGPAPRPAWPPGIDDDDLYDPHGLHGPAPGMGHYGDGDLFGAPGRYGQVPGGYRGGFGGSSEIGPHHPGFGPGVNDPYAGGFGGGNGGGYGGGRGGGGYGGFSGGQGGIGAPRFEPPPPGARFDPFGPPVAPGTAPRRGPDPNLPPGFDNTYS